MSSILDDLLPVADELRALAGSPDFELHPYTVKIRRRTWSGLKLVSATPETADLVIGALDSEGALQPPKVRIISTREIAASGGTYQDGDFRVGPVTPRYDDGTVRGGYYPAVTLPLPAAPTVSVQGTAGSTTYKYKVIGFNGADGVSEVSAAGATSTGNATLDGANFNRLSGYSVSGADRYEIFRTSGGPTQGLIASTAQTTFDDTGLVGDGSSAIPPVIDIEPDSSTQDACILLVGKEGTLECSLVEKRFDRAFRIVFVARKIRGPARG